MTQLILLSYPLFYCLRLFSLSPLGQSQIFWRWARKPVPEAAYDTRIRSFDIQNHFLYIGWAVQLRHSLFYGSFGLRKGPGDLERGKDGQLVPRRWTVYDR